jgi:hypothetical protein
MKYEYIINYKELDTVNNKWVDKIAGYESTCREVLTGDYQNFINDKLIYRAYEVKSEHTPRRTIESIEIKCKNSNPILLQNIEKYFLHFMHISFNCNFLSIKEIISPPQLSLLLYLVVDRNKEMSVLDMNKDSLVRSILNDDEDRRWFDKRDEQIATAFAIENPLIIIDRIYPISSGYVSGIGTSILNNLFPYIGQFRDFLSKYDVNYFRMHSFSEENCDDEDYDDSPDYEYPNYNLGYILKALKESGHE